MSDRVSPRGTYKKVADALRSRVQSDVTVTELPSHAEIVHEFDVSRGVAIRAVNLLKEEGLVESVPGLRWRVVRGDRQPPPRLLMDRIAEVITEDGLTVGASFPSTAALCERFGMSRPTVRRALDKLEAQGLLSAGSQGKVRTVLALPGREGTAKP
ncbi:GntR family transcriptional regulator [Streptomyces sp. NBC_00669]|uniref:GntR family transcriptional regulator n=1 Tax=Streptomyces sp. NBC_00669 TaxID=2976011 RepID=UPI002E2ED1EC|nr:GntR family transcriptional regulator [Streptomyces sp. NBC_00669]